MSLVEERPGKKQAPRISWIGLLVVAAIGIGGCSSGAVAPPDVVDTWSPPLGAEPIATLSWDEIGELFAYDAQAPLDVQEVDRRAVDGVTVIDLTYASPMGGWVPATLVVPDGAGPFAGMLYVHGMPDTRQTWIPVAATYARMGAVVLLIDAPFARRPTMPRGWVDHPGVALCAGLGHLARIVHAPCLDEATHGS